MKNAIDTKHHLDFEACDGQGFLLDLPGFKIGTCKGLWGSCWDSFFILSIVNKEQGNGHLDDVLEWFEYACRRDNKNLIFLDIVNERFYTHLIAQRGFVPLDQRGEHVIKIFNQDNYEQLKIRGNEILRPGTLETI